MPSTLNFTESTPAPAEAVAWTVIDPETVEPFFGLVIVTVGGDTLFTVTVMLAPAVFPATSATTAVIVWDPFEVVVVFHDVEYGADVTVASSAPST